MSMVPLLDSNQLEGEDGKDIGLIIANCNDNRNTMSVCIKGRRDSIASQLVGSVPFAQAV